MSPRISLNLRYVPPTQHPFELTDLRYVPTQHPFELTDLHAVDEVVRPEDVHGREVAVLHEAVRQRGVLLDEFRVTLEQTHGAAAREAVLHALHHTSPCDEHESYELYPS